MKQYLDYDQIKSMVIDILPDLGDFDVIVSVSPKGDSIAQIIANQTQKELVHYGEMNDMNFEFDLKYLIVNSYIGTKELDQELMHTFEGTDHLYYSLVVDLENNNNHWDQCSMRTYDEIVFPWDKE